MTESDQDALACWENEGGSTCQPPSAVILTHPRAPEGILIPVRPGTGLHEQVRVHHCQEEKP